MDPADDFDGDGPRSGKESDTPLLIDVDGYEGPLDLLLDLARRQKVDLTKISILALADQYLVFVEKARSHRIELAADYLVMAAWLAFLKSKLLLPSPEKGEGPSADDLATALALRLHRLSQIRDAAKKLASRDRLGIEIFPRGEPEAITRSSRHAWDANLFDLLQAYASKRVQTAQGQLHVGKRMVWSLLEARKAIEKLVGDAGDWTGIDPYLEKFSNSFDAPPAKMRVTVTASALSAMLEMVREGVLDLKQEAPFAPISFRRRQGASSSG